MCTSTFRMTERSFSAKRGVLRPVAISHTIMLRRRIWIGQTIGHTSAAQLRRVRTVIEKFADAVPIVQVLTDQVWEAWDAGETDDQVAWLAWWLIAGLFRCYEKRSKMSASDELRD